MKKIVVWRRVTDDDIGFHQGYMLHIKCIAITVLNNMQSIII